MKRPHRIFLRSLAFAGFFIFSLCSWAQEANQHMDQGTNKMFKSADIAFIVKASQGSLAEVKIGRLAAEKGADPDVKAFGQQMADEHTKVNDRLKVIAQDQGMALPSDTTQKQQAAYNKLSQLSGVAFDKEYVKEMVVDHEEDVKAFHKEANNGKDEKIKAFSAQTLPELQQHLDKLKTIQSKINNTPSM